MAFSILENHAVAWQSHKKRRKALRGSVSDTQLFLAASTNHAFLKPANTPVCEALTTGESN